MTLNNSCDGGAAHHHHRQHHQDERAPLLGRHGVQATEEAGATAHAELEESDSMVTPDDGGAVSSVETLPPRQRCCSRRKWLVRSLATLVVLVVLACIGYFVILPRINIYHPSHKPAQRIPPGPPHVVLTTTTSTAASITWTAPNNTGTGVILHYRIQQRKEHSNFTTVSQTYSFNFTFSGLRADTWYCFRVCAVSSVGPGNYSTVCNVTAPPHRPASVVGVVPLNSSESTITIGWGPLHCGGSACDLVEVQGRKLATPLGSPAAAALSSSSPCQRSCDYHSLGNATNNATALTVHELPSNTLFMIRLRAHNHVGFGAFSKPLALQTNAVHAGLPGACPGPRVGNITAGAMAVRWSRNCTTNGAQLLTVEVQVSSTNRTTGFHTLSNSFLSTSYSLTGLRALHTYCFRLRAITAIGSGPWSNATCASTTKGGTPLPPAILPAPLSANGTSLTIGWRKPGDGGHPILRYDVEQDNWWIDEPLRLAGNTTRLQFTTTFPLFPSATYTFRVRACNAIGCGAFSNNRHFTTARTGHCANSKDAHAYKATKSTMKPSIQGCLISCVASGTSCVITCIEKKVGLSKGCANCWAQEGLCTLKNCILPCTNPKSKKCAECSEKKCFPACVACSGVPRQYFPP
ncbi:hypothetical protein PTSG_00536 [Salpingoeca rosetta]|uniref:Fibronectin type-III domain-containing protein n=1 Tax=Salpingoeca rosetta (strain ATCC 50818 / BSB-021) TaxID=946362 RepID=F2TWR9_SALR5|nr:uncharacterized protein PTSG_00536 [Salpingoeca rosetta]EGD72515.1 hypothetical protein PTSG_00536 [Salpingoeca rosetta]|eukprot:XP_004999084.1 hypothetical protein PTSG_00536 [Salpingoeca rosetta]